MKNWTLSEMIARSIDDDLVSNLHVNLDEGGVMEILNDDLDSVEALYNVTMPIGRYTFEVTDAKLVPQEMRIDKNSDEKVTVPSISFTLKVDEVVKIAPGKDLPDEADLLNIRLTERITAIPSIPNPVETFKRRLKAMLNDMMGRAASGTIADLLAEIVGCKFQANVSHRKDPKDSSKVYPQLVRGRKGDIVAV